MSFLQRIRDQFNHIFYPLEDRQNRLRIGSLVFTGGIEQTQEDLRRLTNPIVLNPVQLEGCLNEYKEWMKSNECQELKQDAEGWEREQRALKAYEQF